LRFLVAHDRTGGTGHWLLFAKSIVIAYAKPSANADP
jgi:hypothetical protein